MLTVKLMAQGSQQVTTVKAKNVWVTTVFHHIFNSKLRQYKQAVVILIISTFSSPNHSSETGMSVADLAGRALLRNCELRAGSLL